MSIDPTRSAGRAQIDAPKVRKERRWQRLCIQVREPEKAAVEAYAATLGITAHALMRRAVLGIVQEVPDVGKEELDRLAQAVDQVRSIGVLLNQVARAVHQGKRITVDPELLELASREVGQARDAMRTVVAQARTRALRRGAGNG